ncbi:hypothetical protein ASG01_08595 [Chryseobacterium sp. Leaf180]|jgi:hypothetical protein|uniref:hypothetical protein n=1 Tax=Chryseobacterium sp. Leaf180 TaxID=1736289 RepID=UPI0006FBB42C|nr:hypothetical protein [Chryseobacterium sp. Leaf180]KQR93906.1 hypothetical protein ASG01_08595 [Chryseobacterium sp. Leaf180]
MRIGGIILFASIFFCGKIAAQSTGSRSVRLTLPVVALLSVVPSDPIILNFTAPGEAGNRLVNPSSNDAKWINYSSAIAQNSPNRVITAAISQNITGITIRLNTSNASGGGGGVLGSPVNQVTLSTVPITIISGIGGAFTGIGVNYGHKITFSADVNDYKSLTAASNNVINVIYTISDF